MKSVGGISLQSSPLRWYLNKERIKSLQKIRDSFILEVGASTNSYEKYLHCSNKIIKIDMIPKNTVLVGDIRNLSFKSKTFDVVICFNVLEHVFEVEKAISECSRVLKKGGLFIGSVPFFYPLHFLPKDYWRFTKYSLKKLFNKKFKIVNVKSQGLKRLPFSYFLECVK